MSTIGILASFVAILWFIDCFTHTATMFFNRDVDMSLKFSAASGIDIKISGDGFVAKTIRDYVTPINFKHIERGKEIYISCAEILREPDHIKYAQILLNLLLYAYFSTFFSALTCLKSYCLGILFPLQDEKRQIHLAMKITRKRKQDAKRYYYTMMANMISNRWMTYNDTTANIARRIWPKVDWVCRKLSIPTV